MDRKSIEMEDIKGSDNGLVSVEYASMLYDFYGALLNDSRSNVMALYHEDNLSLSEIADELGMTRQAVHYTLKKAEHTLKDLEDKLGLLKAYRRNRELAGEANHILDRAEFSDEDIARLKNIIGTIAE